MNLIKLTRYTGEPNDKDPVYDIYVDYELIVLIEDTENATLVYLRDGLRKFNEPLRVMEEAEKIRGMIGKLETSKLTEKLQNISIHQKVDAVSKDWVEPIIDYGKETQV